MSLFNTLIPTLTRIPARRSGVANSPDIGPAIKPAYEIKETDDAFGVTVQLPGVTKDGLEMTVEQDQFRIIGRRTWKQPEGWTALYRESVDVPFELVLEHDNSVDLEKIHADLNAGVLRVALPKAAAIKPRRIAVS